jgi:ABC-type transport system involved in multi-copper enzyme maturation permease subunit
VKNLIKAEFRKVFTTQVWFWMLLVCLGLTAAGVAIPIGTSHDPDVRAHVHDILTIVVEVPTYVPLFVLGVLSVTTEYRHQTITPTVLATPSRPRLITAKLIATALLGVAYALACVVLELAIALPWLAARNIPVHLSSHLGAIFGVFLVLALFAVVGLGAGALMKNQIVAISVGVGFVLIVDQIIVGIPGAKHVYPYLLSGATRAITNSAGDRVMNGVRLLSPGGGVLVLIAWGVVMGAIGAALTMNRDIT